MEAQWALKRWLESASSYAASRSATDAMATARSLESPSTVTSRRQSLDTAEIATIQSIESPDVPEVRNPPTEQTRATMIDTVATSLIAVPTSQDDITAVSSAATPLATAENNGAPD